MISGKNETKTTYEQIDKDSPFHTFRKIPALYLGKRSALSDSTFATHVQELNAGENAKTQLDVNTCEKERTGRTRTINDGLIIEADILKYSLESNTELIAK